MDGVVGQEIRALADLAATPPVTVTVTDPVGQEILSHITTTQLKPHRYRAVISASLVQLPGIYRVVWEWGAVRWEQLLLVGSPGGLAVPLWELLLGVAGHLEPVRECRSAGGDTSTVQVPALAAPAGAYRGKYLWIHPEDDAVNGIPGSYRIADSQEDGTLILSQPLAQPVPAGSRVMVFTLPEEEIRRCLGLAWAEYGRLVRMPCTFTVTLTQEAATLPRGLTHVSAVFQGRQRLADTAWGLAPQRTLTVPGVTGEVTVSGLLQEALPQLMTGMLDAEAAALLAHAGVYLHSARAGGAAMDVEEHLRRMVTLGQLAEASVPRLASRVPHGAREVIP